MSNSERHKQKRKEREKEKHKGNAPLFQKAIDKSMETITKKMAGKGIDENAKTVMKVADRFGMPNEKLAAEVIKSAEKDIADCIKKGMSDEDILRPAFESPNYQKLLKRCGLNNSHLEAILELQRKEINGDN